MSKILNPVVLIHKRENSDTYAVAITSGSQDYHDAVLMATMEPDMTGDSVDTWSKTGYYMAQEIESWRRVAALAIARLDSADDKNVWQAVGFALGALECAAAGEIAGSTQNSRHIEKVQVVQEQCGTLPTEEQVQSCDNPGSVPVHGVTTGKPLTITLPALPVLGSKEEWYQGFAAGAGSMREECAAMLISAGIGVEVK
ncbi:ATPase [Enterobacter hormaechei]|nr:ATPase [Enterobacter hormaechei]